ncbi:hypothetical protein ARMGADRAFT_1033903 [Armillaria gallica]|uniref:Uncharacterized protein n=1 Tax=Armillaria gallica TaxID=47427 RepID=A0A2H3DCD9_ARMGA|nr:hypothetical protein ARMGADRAFT_1033903 [Armillaria gallica]
MPTTVGGLGYQGHNAQLFAVPPLAAAFIALGELSAILTTGKILSSGTYAADVLPWEKEVNNSLPATMNILASHEPQSISTSSGKTLTANCSYYKSLLEATEAKGMTCPNLKKDHAFTLTHLGHAMLAIVIINDNPPTPDQSSGTITLQALANCHD